MLGPLMTRIFTKIPPDRLRGLPERAAVVDRGVAEPLVERRALRPHRRKVRPLRERTAVGRQQLQRTQELIALLEDGPDFLDYPDTELCGALVAEIIVESNDTLRFRLHNGLELRESMGNRKQPFGYRMTLGEITILPEEAELVRFIFQGYSTGATLGELTKALCRQEIPYYESQTWNKNMVSRILEDSRYIGEKGYPALIEPEQLRAAAEKRTARACPPQKTPAQKAVKRVSGSAIPVMGSSSPSTASAAGVWLLKMTE